MPDLNDAPIGPADASRPSTDIGSGAAVPVPGVTAPAPGAPPAPAAGTRTAGRSVTAQALDRLNPFRAQEHGK